MPPCNRAFRRNRRLPFPKWRDSADMDLAASHLNTRSSRIPASSVATVMRVVGIRLHAILQFVHQQKCSLTHNVFIPPGAITSQAWHVPRPHPDVWAHFRYVSRDNNVICRCYSLLSLDARQRKPWKTQILLSLSQTAKHRVTRTRLHRSCNSQRVSQWN